MDTHKVEVVDVMGLKVATFRCETGEILVSLRDILEASLSDVAEEIAFLRSPDGLHVLKAMNIYPSHCYRNGMYEEGLFIQQDYVNHYLFSIRKPGEEIDTLRMYLSAEIARHWAKIRDSAAGYTPQQLRTYVMHSSDEKLSMALSGFNLDNHDDVMRTLRQFALKELGYHYLWDNLSPMEMDIYNAVLSTMGSLLFKCHQEMLSVEESMELMYQEVQKVITGFKSVGPA